MSTFTLQDLEARVHERAAAAAEQSYTRKLLDKGVAHCAKKLGEEAVELAIAAVSEDRAHMIAEAADVRADYRRPDCVRFDGHRWTAFQANRRAA